MRSFSPFLISLALCLPLTHSLRAASDAMPAPAPASQTAKGQTVANDTSCVLSQDQVLSAVHDQLVSHFNLEGELQLELLRPWVAPAPTKSPANVTVTEFPSQPSGSMMLRVRADAGNVVICETLLTFRAQLWRDSWSTREAVKRDEIFDPASLEVRRVDVFRERDALPATSGDRNFAYSRGIPANRLVTTRDITRRAMVKKGDMVEVEACEGPITITMKAVALQSGSSGDTISVRNITSKKDIAALVVSENRVQVRF